MMVYDDVLCRIMMYGDALYVTWRILVHDYV